MSEAVVDDIVAVLPPLLQSLETLGFIARHLNPPQFGQVMEAAGEPDQALQAVRPRLEDWPEQFLDIQTSLQTAADAALKAFSGLREVQHGNGDLVAVFRALRHVPRALEALYALAAKLPPVSGFFVDPALREDAGLAARLAEPANANTGIIHDHNEPGSRGGFSLYVPEYYTPERSWPLVVAMHGGSGNGRAFLWSWLRDARGFGAILVAPTATGGTKKKTPWALMKKDSDTPEPRAAFSTSCAAAATSTRQAAADRDERRRHVVLCRRATVPLPLLTHLAPVAATFHPLMAEMADAKRLRGLPVYLVHGRLDWMFPVQVARQTREALSAAGADVTYREIEDLSHCYPREMNAEILRWLGGDR